MSNRDPISPAGLGNLRGVGVSARTGEVTAWQALLERSGLGELEVLRRCAERMGLPLFDSLEGERVSDEFTSRVPVHFARRHAIVGLETEQDEIAVTTACPLDFRPIDDVAKLLQRPVRPALAPRAEIVARLESAYKERMRAESKVSEDLGDLEDLIDTTAALAASEDLLDLSRRPPLVRLLDRILLQALERDASDVHFQPTSEKLQVRFRVDGVLHDMIELPRSVQSAITSRVKVMGRMDVAERRLAQDGRCTVTVGGDHVDLRISSLPTAEGEEIVLRLLHRDSRLLTLGELGMCPETAAAFDGLIHATHGIVLVTGPTGSGKTTTLYAALQELDSRSTHVVTLEDPIEYQLEGVSQSQVNYKKGLTFATGLRNVLRQDPDIIMVGEIRDLDTARMAIQSALTGHLVLSTLHTNDAVSAATRLLDLGIEPYLVNSALAGVVAQRLVRRICPECKTECAPAGALLARAGMEDVPGRLWAGAGCEHCLGTGYKGRTGVFELLRVGDALREMIAERLRPSEMRRVLVQDGLRTMLDDGVEKAKRGVTTLEEVFRVTQNGLE